MSTPTEAPPIIADYVALLHRYPASALGQELAELLANPLQTLPRLSIFTPEVGLMLTRMMFLRDYDAVSDLADALDGPLQSAAHGRRDHLRPEDEADLHAFAEVRYYLGRLTALLVIARRFQLLDSLQRLRQEYLDGGLAQTVMELLQAGAPRSQRSIRTALRAQAASRIQVRQTELREVLKRLVRDELVAQKAGPGRGQVLELTPLGQQLLQDEPPWVADVEEAYRNYRRLQVGEVQTATQRSLVKLFVRLDREAGRDLPEPAPQASSREFPYVDDRRLPDKERRGLPRIIP